MELDTTLDFFPSLRSKEHLRIPILVLLVNPSDGSTEPFLVVVRLENEVKGIVLQIENAMKQWDQVGVRGRRRREKEGYFVVFGLVW